MLIRNGELVSALKIEICMINNNRKNEYQNVFSVRSTYIPIENESKEA